MPLLNGNDTVQVDDPHDSGARNGDQDANRSISTAVQEKFANYRPDSGNGQK
jgi:hypothetical protein